MSTNNQILMRPHRRVLTSEFNVHRACVFGTRSNIHERVIQRKTADGFIEESRVSPIEYNGKLRSLTVVEGTIWDALELMFREQGKPASNRVYFRASHFYDYLTDLSAIGRQQRHAHKDGSHVRDWLDDHLHIMQHVSLSKKYWRTKNGSRYSPEPLRLIREYFIYSHEKKTDPRNTHQGLSWVEINEKIAENVREGVVQPIFYEVKNSIQNEMARVIYPQLTPLLFKNLRHREPVIEFEKRFDFNIKKFKNLLAQLRKAGQSLIGLPIPFGKRFDAKITSFDISRDNSRAWNLTINAEKVLFNHRVNIQPPSPILDIATQAILERDKEMMRRYESLTNEEKANLRPAIRYFERVRYGGFKTQAAIVDAVEEMGKFRGTGDNEFYVLPDFQCIERAEIDLPQDAENRASRQEALKKLQDALRLEEAARTIEAFYPFGVAALPHTAASLS